MSVDIYINEKELELINLLKTFVRESPTCPTKKNIRFAGGWVRDKLLKLNSSDIDVTIEDCTGEVFAAALLKWMSESNGDSVSINAKVKANPEQSKHLETTMVTFSSLGLDVDFVSFRSERYEGNSRIPIVTVGSPKEDAFRRDFTVNALFFNICTNKIEDWTMLGMDDLEAKIFRTPLDPVRTFLDDPLRTVRLVRFISKFPDFIYDPQIDKVLENEEVRSALRLKVSPQRIHQEFVKLHKYDDISQAYRIMFKWNLWSLILPASAGEVASLHSNIDQKYITCAIMFDEFMKQFLSVVNVGKSQLIEFLKISELYLNFPYLTFKFRGLLLFSILLYCYVDFGCNDNKKRFAAVQHALNWFSCSSFFKSTTEIIMLIFYWLDFFSQNYSTSEREHLIKILTQKKSKEFWLYALIIAALLYFQITDTEHFVELNETLHKVLDLIVNKYDFDGIWECPRLLNGNIVKAMLLELKSQPNFNCMSDLMAFQDQFIYERFSQYKNSPETLKIDLINKMKEFIASNY